MHAGSRIAILEGLTTPQCKDEENLVELFPEAKNVLSFQYDASTEG